MEKINARVFLKVAETGSFRKTADVLGYTQAGISYIINSMEEEMGITLFTREHNGVKLSREGEQIIPLVRQLGVSERHLELKINELKGLDKGVLRVQIFDSVAVHWLPGILKRFHNEFPGIDLDFITEEDTVRQQEMVMSGEVDCGFFLTEVRSEIDSFPLIEENLLAVVSKDHPLAAKDYFPISEIGNYPYIRMKFEEETGVGNIFTKNNIKPDIVFKMDNDYAALAMVSEGIGYCIHAELLLKNIPFNVHTMEFDVPQKRVISIGTRSVKTCSKACLKFMEFTRQWVKENT